MYKVDLSDQAKRFYAEAELALARKLARGFILLEQNPRSHPNIKPLKGEWAGHYRYRVGDYRIVYRVDDPARAVSVAVIAHRREVYQQ